MKKCEYCDNDFDEADLSNDGICQECQEKIKKKKKENSKINSLLSDSDIEPPSNNRIVNYSV